MNEKYEPREDSYLLLKYVKKYAHGIVLDIGTGSGIQAIGAAKKKNVKKVVAVDISKKTIQFLKNHFTEKKIQFIVSDMFSNVKGKFDTIIFNPPYLPDDARVKDLTVDGGKKGYEIIEKFLDNVNNYIKPNSLILMVFSSLTKKEQIDDIIIRNMLDCKELEKKHVFFEDLYVYLIKKSKILLELEKKNIKNIKKMTKGHRGLVYTGIHRGKKVAIKIKNPKSEAIGRILNEAQHLKILNQYGIGPNVIYFSKDYLAYDFIEGEFILDFIKKQKKKNIIAILKKVFNQMFILDTLRIDKEEMHHPVKHVIIRNNKPILIDFERAHLARCPHNVTQFCEFLMRFERELKKKKIKIKREKIIELARNYKKDMTKKNFEMIIKQLK